MRPLRAAGALACAVALAAGATACGEKDEPDLSQLPPVPQPQAADPPQRLPRAVVGRWQGTLRQQGLKPFSIRVEIASATDRKQNVVRYGGEIDCSGTWSYLGVESPQVRFRERIGRGGGGDCKSEGTVSLRPLPGEPERLGYEFRGRGVESRGALRRP